MTGRRILQLACFALIFWRMPIAVSGEEITKAIQSFLQQRVEVEKRSVGIVVGMVDEHGRRIVSCGKLDNGTDKEVDGDTLFEIGSITKTFTTLLLQDMIERGEMKLDYPVAVYLHESVKMPNRHAKEITLLQLATHTSGLPRNPDNLATRRADHPLENYTDEELYSFLSNYKLTRAPGAKFEYSNLGMGLLGEAIARKAGTNYGSLVVDRICRPLNMNSTRITLPPELKSRFAQGHNWLGYTVSSCEFGSLQGCGALRSTARDLLNYLSAQLGLIPSGLTPVMEKTHAVHFHSLLQAARFGGNIGLGWLVLFDPQGGEIIWHGGSTPGFRTFVAIDESKHRGVVVLSDSCEASVDAIGMLLLESEWQSDRRPNGTNVSSRIYDSLVGQYQLSADIGLGIWILRFIAMEVPKAAIYLSAIFCLSLLGFILWCTRTLRKRVMIVGGAAVLGCLLAVLSVPVASHVFCTLVHPGIGIRRTGERLFVEDTLRPSTALIRLLHPGVAQPGPHMTGEILSDSPDRLFERMSGIPMGISRDQRGEVTRLTAHFLGGEFSFRKVSVQPPKYSLPPKLRTAISLDTNLLDACVGRYEVAPQPVWPREGAILTICREGEQLLLRVAAKDISQAPIEIYPESPTNFFLKINDEQLTFLKSNKGEVMAVVHHMDGLPDVAGRKQTVSSN